MDRQPRAQNAYAPCASASGWAEMPPSNVWPGGVVSAATGTGARAVEIFSCAGGGEVGHTYIYGRSPRAR